MQDNEQIGKMVKTMLDEQTKAIVERMNESDKTIAPIVAIYNQVNGFGNVTSFIFRKFIIPFSIFIGIILSVRKLFSGHAPIP